MANTYQHFGGFLRHLMHDKKIWTYRQMYEASGITPQTLGKLFGAETVGAVAHMHSGTLHKFASFLGWESWERIVELWEAERVKPRQPPLKFHRNETSASDLFERVEREVAAGKSEILARLMGPIPKIEPHMVPALCARIAEMNSPQVIKLARSIAGDVAMCFCVSGKGEELARLTGEILREIPRDDLRLVLAQAVEVSESLMRGYLGELLAKNAGEPRPLQISPAKKTKNAAYQMRNKATGKRRHKGSDPNKPL